MTFQEIIKIINGRLVYPLTLDEKCMALKNNNSSNNITAMSEWLTFDGRRGKGID